MSVVVETVVDVDLTILPLCEHSCHWTMPWWHDGPAAYLIDANLNCCGKPSRRMLLCERAWTSSAGLHLACRYCGAWRSRDECWRVVTRL